MTPEAFAAWVGGAGTAIVTVTRAASWMLKTTAANKVERRVETDAAMSALKAELADAQKACEMEKTRRIEAEWEKEVMERILYRLGYERKSGGWKPNGGGEVSKP